MEVPRRSVRSGVCHFVTLSLCPWQHNTSFIIPSSREPHNGSNTNTSQEVGMGAWGESTPGAWHPNIPWSPAPAPTPSRSVGRDILARSLKQKWLFGDRQRFETCKVERVGLCLAIPISRLPAVDPAFAQKAVGRQRQARRVARVGRWAVVTCGSLHPNGVTKCSHPMWPDSGFSVVDGHVPAAAGNVRIGQLAVTGRAGLVGGRSLGESLDFVLNLLDQPQRVTLFNLKQPP